MANPKKCEDYKNEMDNVNNSFLISLTGEKYVFNKGSINEGKLNYGKYWPILDRDKSPIMTKDGEFYMWPYPDGGKPYSRDARNDLLKILAYLKDNKKDATTSEIIDVIMPRKERRAIEMNTGRTDEYVIELLLNYEVIQLSNYT